MFVLLKVQSLQLSFRPAGVSLGGGGGGQGPLLPPLGTPLDTWWTVVDLLTLCMNLTNQQGRSQAEAEEATASSDSGAGKQKV